MAAADERRHATGSPETAQPEGRMLALLVIQHVPHERLGTFEAVLTRSGCTLRFLNTYDPKAAWPSLADVQGIIVMGGPMSVNQQARYPFLTKELALLRAAIAAKHPILGVCLGAQLVAHALGAQVDRADQPEIGWYPVKRGHSADGDPMFAPFGETETVFQWHSDAFTLPQRAVRLSSSPLCREQAFRYGDNVYGLQFHVEVTEAMVRAWMQTPANKTELAKLRGRIDPMAIRRQSPHYTARLQELSHHVATAFCDLMRPSRTQRPTHAR